MKVTAITLIFLIFNLISLNSWAQTDPYGEMLKTGSRDPETARKAFNEARVKQVNELNSQVKKSNPIADSSKETKKTPQFTDEKRRTQKPTAQDLIEFEKYRKKISGETANRQAVVGDKKVKKVDSKTSPAKLEKDSKDATPTETSTPIPVRHDPPLEEMVFPGNKKTSK